MKFFARSMMLVLAASSLTSLAQADMTFKNDARGDLLMTIKDNGTAEIILILPDGGKIPMIEGSVVGKDSDLVIQREEGDVCPSVEVQLYHDIKLGENQGAVVRAKIEETGSAAKQYCGDLKKMDGAYSRVN